MSESKHTKGKWEINMECTPWADSEAVAHIFERDSIVATVINEKYINLIATAPELLEALKYVLMRIRDMDEWWIDDQTRGFDVDKIEAAISKAEGR